MNPTYVPRSLSAADRRKQIRSIRNKTIRPKVNFRSRRSPWVIRFEKRHGYKISEYDKIAETLLDREGIEKVLRKGRGAYFSSGSRPNQTPESWARARLASVIMGGPAREVDKAIWEEHSL